MTRTTTARRVAAAFALLAVATGAPTGPATSAAAADDRQRAEQRTTVTFTVDDCEGCEIRLEKGRETDDGVKFWRSTYKEVDGGEVSFTVASRRTRGMAVLLRAPWEGHIGHETTVAMRYAGNAVGEKVTFKEARGKKRASACWEGVRATDAVTIPLVVREVMVDGVHERVPGSIAFARKTQQWLDPVRRAYDGVLGSQDINLCG